MAQCTRPWQPDLVPAFLTGLVAFSAALLIWTLALSLQYRSDRIMPGVEALGLSLGGQRREVAARALSSRWDEPTIALSGGDTTIKVSASDLGLMLDAEATADAAHAQGRLVGDLWAALRGAARVVVAPIWTFDPAVADATLLRLAPQFQQAPVDASLQLVDRDVVVIPAIPGRAVDVSASVAWLSDNGPSVLAKSRVPLIMKPVQAARHDTTIAVAQAEQMLTQTLYVQAYDAVSNEALTWSFEAGRWSNWIQLGLGGVQPTDLRIDVDQEKVGAALAERAPELGTGRFVDPAQAAGAIRSAISADTWLAKLTVLHSASKHIVAPDETLASIAFDYGFPYPYIQQANPSLGDELFVGQTVVIPSPDILLPLPVLDRKRIIVSLSQQHMWAYEDGILVWDWPVSTGRETSPTSPGVFQIRSHEASAYAPDWDLLMPNFMGIYEPVPGASVMNGFHGFPLRDGIEVVWMNQLGSPVTFGCIMVSTENSSLLYTWAEEGTVVEVLP